MQQKDPQRIKMLGDAVYAGVFATVFAAGTQAGNTPAVIRADAAIAASNARAVAVDCFAQDTRSA